MHRHGKTTTGKERYKCPVCGKTSTIHRPDTHLRHIQRQFTSWLTGHHTKPEIAKSMGITRRALTKRFAPLFANPPASVVPRRYHPRILVVDGTYAQGTQLCVLIAIDEEDRVFWMFVPRERKASWKDFLSQFPEPDVVVADGQKGLYWAIRELWDEEVAFQRCQFHVIQLVHRYLTRTPREQPAKELLALLLRLKDAKTDEEARVWRLDYGIWEGIYTKWFLEKLPSGAYRYQRLRSARGAMRKALPHLFTFLEYPDCPNTTNDMEGWMNRAVKDAVGRHRGLTLAQEKTLVSVVLSQLKRKKKAKENPTRKFP